MLAGQPGHGPQSPGTARLWFHREAPGSQRGWAGRSRGTEAAFCMGRPGRGDHGLERNCGPKYCRAQGMGYISEKQQQPILKREYACCCLVLFFLLKPLTF